MKKTLEFIGEQHKVTDLLHHHNAVSVAVYGDEKTALNLPFGIQQAYTEMSDIRIYEFTMQDGSLLYTVNELYATDNLMKEEDLLYWLQDYWIDPYEETIFFPDDDIVDSFFGSEYPVCVTETDLYEFARGWGKDFDELVDHCHRATSDEIRNYGLYIG